MPEVENGLKGRNVPSAKLHAEAVKGLIAHHPDEFRARLESVYRAAGYEYKPRLTAEERAERKRQAEVEKAAETVRAIVEKYGSAVLPGPTLSPLLYPDETSGMDVFAGAQVAAAAAAEV